MDSIVHYGHSVYIVRLAGNMGIATGIRGGARLRLLQLHRLLEFERVFSLYLEGKTTASHVTTVAKKLLDVGLPRLR